MNLSHPRRGERGMAAIRSIFDLSAGLLLLVLAGAAFLPPKTPVGYLFYQTAFAIAVAGFPGAIASRIGTGSLITRIGASVLFGIIMFMTNPLSPWIGIDQRTEHNDQITFILDNQGSAQGSAEMRGALKAALDKLKEPRGRGEILLRVGDLESTVGEVEVAEEAFMEAYTLYNRAADTQGEGHVMLALGRHRLNIGEPDSARDSYLAARALFDELEDWAGSNDAIRGLGDVAMFDNDTKQARGYYDQALRGAEQRGDKADELAALLGMSQVELADGDPAKAGAQLRHARALARAGSDELSEGYAIYGLARVEAATDDATEARKLFAEAQAIFRSHEDLPIQAEALVVQARFETRFKQPANAKQMLDIALKIYEKFGNSPRQATVRYLLGDLVKESDKAAAREHFEAAAHLYGVPQTPEGIALAKGAGLGLVP